MTLNIWNKNDFLMSGLGHKFKLFGRIKYICRCLKWSKQRIVNGYCDRDVWNMYGHLQELIPSMLEFLRDNRCGSPAYLQSGYPDEDIHDVWTRELSRMIDLWKDSSEVTCTKKNPYEAEHTKAFDAFVNEYGILGEKLQTEAELAENKKRGGGGTIHFMREIPEYAEIDVKYMDYEKKLEEYRMNCKDEAMDLLKEHFFSLWD